MKCVEGNQRHNAQQILKFICFIMMLVTKMVITFNVFIFSLFYLTSAFPVSEDIDYVQ